MDILHHRHRLLHCQLTLSLATIAFLLLASVPALGFNFNPTRQFSVGAKKITAESVGQDPVRRRLTGPGSSPPTCRSKCGQCNPCKPVHVPIQPGWSRPLEYYPEAWRCKCGNKLFMP